MISIALHCLIRDCNQKACLICLSVTLLLYSESGDVIPLRVRGISSLVISLFSWRPGSFFRRGYYTRVLSWQLFYASALLPVRIPHCEREGQHQRSENNAKNTWQMSNCTVVSFWYYWQRKNRILLRQPFVSTLWWKASPAALNKLPHWLLICTV